MARKTHSRSAAVAALLGYLLLALLLTYPLVRRFADAIPGDGFDGWQNFWNLWWARSALIEQHTQPWFTHSLYYPTGVSLLFHTLNLFNGLVFLPVQLAWGLFPAYNSVVLFSFVLSGLGAYLLARYVRGPRASRSAAFGAGLIFAFSPFHFAHLLGHMQVISMEWLPFFILYLLRSVHGALQVGGWKPEAEGWQEQPRSRASGPGPLIRDMLLAVLFLVLAALCDWYQVLYCLLFTGIVLLWAGLRLWQARATGRSAVIGRGVRLAVAIAGIWLLWTAVLSPLLVPMVRETRQFSYMVPDPDDSRRYSADLLAFVTPQQFHPLWGESAAASAKVFTATVSENQVFAGFTVIALAVAGFLVWPVSRAGATIIENAPAASGRPSTGDGRPPAGGRPGAERAFWLVIVIVFLVLALGPVLHIGGRTDLLPGGGVLPGGGEIALPYAWLARVVPFMSISRSVSRFDAMLMLALAVLAAMGLDWLHRRRVFGRLGVGAALALILFEFLPAPYPMSASDTPAWFATLAQDPRSGSVLNLPMNWDRPNYLLHQTTHGKPLAAGYISRDDPRTLVDLAPVLQHFRHLEPDIIAFDLAAQGREVMHDLGVRWVVIDHYQMPPSPGNNTRQYTLATAAAVFGDQPPAYQDERLTVFDVGEPALRAPYLILGAGWEPFDPESAQRAFSGSARIIVRSPEDGAGTLRVSLAPGSPPLDAPEIEGHFIVPLTLRSGESVVEIRSGQPGQRVVVKELALVR